MASNFDPRSSSSDSQPDVLGQDVSAPLEDASSPYGERPRARRREVDRREASGPKRWRRKMIALFVVPGTLLIVFLVLKFSPIFEIKQISVSPTSHVTSTQVSELVSISQGTTLFGFDASSALGRLKTNPWIESAAFDRVFPDTLAVQVNERTPAAIVMLSNKQGAWLIASDGVWLEPVDLTPAAQTGTETDDVLAKRLAYERGLYCITGVDAQIEAEAGKRTSDDAVLGVLAYREQLSPELSEQIVFATAAEKDSISVTLESGIEVSLGAPRDIAAKDEVLRAILAQYEGQISYINVRTPEAPTFRGLVDGEELGLRLYGEDQVAVGQDVLATSLPYVGSPTAPQATQQQGQSAPADAQAPQSQPAGQQQGAGASSVPSDAAYNGGYYLDDGVTWVNYYYSSEGELIHGYWDENDNFIDMG